VNAHDFANVLVALEGSDGHATALEWALSLCTLSKARLAVVAITAAAAHAPSDSARPATALGWPARILRDARREAQTRGVSVRVELLPETSRRAIINYAAAHDHDLIVLQHRGRYLREVLHPHPTDFAGPHRACPVIVIG
jgi:nucleotide-binding universal stress UspA family protein